VLFPSGTGAVTALVLAFLSPGDTIALAAGAYFGTGVTFKELERWGLHTVEFDQTGAPPDGADLIWLEAPSNPFLTMPDLEAATELARRLEAHPNVSTVRYPGLGGLISFDVAGADQARAVETSLRLITNATSLGGVDSLLEARARWEGDRVPPGLLRLSVGLEPVAALW